MFINVVRAKDPRHVPDNHRDFHAQVRTLLQELLLIQEVEDGIRWQFTIDGVKQDKIYHFIFQFYFSWVIQWNITNCAVYRVVPMLLMFARSAIILAHILMNLAQQ